MFVKRYCHLSFIHIYSRYLYLENNNIVWLPRESLGQTRWPALLWVDLRRNPLDCDRVTWLHDLHARVVSPCSEEQRHGGTTAGMADIFTDIFKCHFLN